MPPDNKSKECINSSKGGIARTHCVKKALCNRHYDSSHRCDIHQWVATVGLGSRDNKIVFAWRGHVNMRGYGIRDKRGLPGIGTVSLDRSLSHTGTGINQSLSNLKLKICIFICEQKKKNTSKEKREKMRNIRQ